MKIKFVINTAIGGHNYITHFVRHRYELGNWENLIFWVRSEEKLNIRTTYSNGGSKLLNTRIKLENKKFFSRLKF
jgi:hypothetical protein